ncbi:MAG TPA: VWA domain-containing protein [Rugosimonospora sp.]
MTGRDLAAELVGLADEVRAEGVDVAPSQVITAVHAVSHVDTLAGLYWATRLAFCSRYTDVVAFDAAFNRWLSAPAPGGTEPWTDTAARDPGERNDGERDIGERDDGVSDDGGSDDSGAAPGSAAAAGATEVLAERDIQRLSAGERDQINVLIAALRIYTGGRRSPRRTRGGHAHIDVARTIRGMVRAGGEPVGLCHRRRARQPRRLVLLLDVSESMDGYSEALMRFAHAAVRAGPARTEVFALGTRVTALTRSLRERDPEAALNLVRAMPTGWGGGTRLGEQLADFLRVWAGRRAVRSSVAVFASDGWESSPELLAAQLTRLRRLAHRVIWVNPQYSWDGFTPAAKGLRYSLTAVHAHVPGHSFDALRSLAALISSV